MLRAGVCVTELAFDVAWLAVGLGERPPALTMASPGSSFAERRVLEEQAWEELHRVGLAQQGRLEHETFDVLSLLDNASRELYGYFAAGENTPWTVTAAIRDDDAVLARVADGWVSLDPVRATNVVESVLRVLPALNKAPGATLSAPLSAARGHTPQSEGVLQRSDGGGGDARAGERIRQALGRPRLGGGQFYAAGRDRWGKRSRNPALVSVVDTVDGRYLSETRSNDRGEPWVVLAPADESALSRGFNGLLSAL